MWAIRLVAVCVFEVNAGYLPGVVGSLCRNGCGSRCGRSFRPVALSLAEIHV